MRNIMILAAFMVGLGTLMAQVADRMTPARASTVRPAPVQEAAPTGIRSLSIPLMPAATSRPKAGSMASASASWSIPARL